MSMGSMVGGGGVVYLGVAGARGAVGASPPLLFWVCLFGVVFMVCLLFGGYFRVVLVLFCYCSATE